MPLLAIDCLNDQPVPHRGGDLRACLVEALADLPERAPVVIILHGYKFSPATAKTNPHTHILSLKPRKGCWKAVSWPRHLGFGRGAGDEGLCVAFGWEARGTIWQAWRAARRASVVLADLIRDVRAERTGPVDIVGHSLGARVALGAMRMLPAGSLGRVILLAGAEFQSTAATALSTPAGRTAEVVNVTSRENLLFDRLLELFVRAPVWGDRTLGAGLWSGADNWLDINVDGRRERWALRRLGHRIARPKRKVCHWWGYLRPGLMPFYQDLIRRREELTFQQLRAEVFPEPPAIRYSARPARHWRLWRPA